MKTPIEKKTTPLKDIVVTENPDLDQVFGDLIFLPEKNELVEEQIRTQGLPKELAIK